MSKADRFNWTPQVWQDWIETTDILSQEQLREMTVTVLRSLEHGRLGLVLDAGCGFGRFSSLLLQKIPDVRIVGIDASSTMIRSANKLGKTGRFGSVLGELESPPFRSNSFDTVICFGVIMHVEDDRRVLLELAQLVRPGGRFIFTFHNRLNPFSLPLAVHRRMRRPPAGYRETFRSAAFYMEPLRRLGFDVRILHPGFLFPGFIVSRRTRLDRLVTLIRELNRISVTTPTRFGFTPVFEALKRDEEGDC